MPDRKFFMTRDGVRIAYAEHGSGPPLVYVRGWLSHLDLLWEREGYRTFIETLSTRFRVVRFDMRGNGVSDRDVSNLSIKVLVAELEDLLNHLGLDRVILWGSSFGGPIAMRFASLYPEKVERLILDGTYARGSAITQPVRRFLLVNALRFFPEMGFLLLSNATHPDPRRSAQRTLEIGTQMVNPKVGARLYRLAFRVDVSKFLSAIQAPTLVLHAMRSRSVPARLGQDVAAQIAGASFVGLDSDQQNLWEGDLKRLFMAVSPFLGVPLTINPAEVSLSHIREPQPVPEEPFLFLCYSHLDASELGDIVRKLQQQGFPSWIDSSISPGAVWREQIARAVEACDVFLLFASKHSLASPYCIQEVNFAVDENRSILVVYLEDVELPRSLRMSLSSRQAIHMRDYSRAIFEEKLIQGVRGLMSRSRPSQ